ncbi:MAG: hypothetical protein ACLPX7_27305 [Xanthobacteraceae bacterium]
MILALAAGCADVAGAQAPPSTFATPTVAIMATDPGLSGQLGNEDPLYIKLTYRSEQPVSLRAEGRFRGETVPGMVGNTVMQLSGAGEALVSIAYRASAKVDAIKINVFDDRWRALTSIEASADLAWTTAPSRDPSGYAEWVIPLKQIDDQRARWLAVTSPDTWIAVASMLSVPAYLVLQFWLGLAWTGGWRWAAFLPLVLTLPALSLTVYATSRGANLAPMPILLAAPPALFYLLIAWVLHKVMRRSAAV